MHLLAISRPSFENYPFRWFACLLVGLFSLLYLSFVTKHSINLLSDFQLAEIFSLPVQLSLLCRGFWFPQNSIGQFLPLCLFPNVLFLCPCLRLAQRISLMFSFSCSKVSGLWSTFQLMSLQSWRCGWRYGSSVCQSLAFSQLFVEKAWHLGQHQAMVAVLVG